MNFTCNSQQKAQHSEHDNHDYFASLKLQDCGKPELISWGVARLATWGFITTARGSSGVPSSEKNVWMIYPIIYLDTIEHTFLFIDRAKVHEKAIVIGQLSRSVSNFPLVSFLTHFISLKITGCIQMEQLPCCLGKRRWLYAHYWK